MSISDKEARAWELLRSGDADDFRAGMALLGEVYYEEGEHVVFPTDEDFLIWLHRVRPEYAHTFDWNEHPDDWNDECWCYDCRTCD